MKKNILYLIIIFCSLLSCNDNEADSKEQKLRETFQEQTKEGLYLENEIILCEPSLYQLSSTDDMKSCRIQSDNQDFFFSCKFKNNIYENELIMTELATQSIENIKDGEYIANIIKHENKKYWIWFPELYCGIIVQFIN